MGGPGAGRRRLEAHHPTILEGDDDLGEVGVGVIHHRRGQVAVVALHWLHVLGVVGQELRPTGGERLAEAENGPAVPAAPEEEPGEKKDLSGLGKVYGMVAKFLNLSGQMESIDYTAENFVHADLTMDEFSEKQQERGESVLGFAFKSAKNAPEPALPLAHWGEHSWAPAGRVQ